MNVDRRHFLIMLPAAAIAWKYVLAGTPEESPNYKMSDHWWSMLIDIPKCIGCGNCVRACALENDVPEGHFRTWVERYHVTDWDMVNPEVISPDGGKEGFPAAQVDDNGKYFFVPKLCNHCADSPCTQVCPVGATFISPDGVVLIDQTYCLGCAYCVQACPTAAATSIRKRKSRTSARSVITGSPRDSPPPAAKPVPPARANWPT